YIENNSVDEHTGEERFDAIGMIGGNRMVFVVYVERVTTGGNDIIRIISARKADKKERKRYVNGD
ncbi:MAG: BrnT family toxin, partial [Synergistaceae bacterium]|nr:BrnT family toxin [Synergistaceae bacterium]